jgi:AcrR family transcriptional regulator
MRDIAQAADVPLATVVYHFMRKEHLYAALLYDIGRELLAGLEATSTIDGFIEGLVRFSIDEPGRIKLLLRELLDNPARVKKAAQLPLAPFLERAAELIETGRAAGIADVESAELAVLHVVGAVSYVVAAWPTVERIVGGERSRKLHGSYEREAIAFARRALGLEETYGSRAAMPARASRARTPRA